MVQENQGENLNSKDQAPKYNTSQKKLIWYNRKPKCKQ